MDSLYLYSIYENGLTTEDKKALKNNKVFVIGVKNSKTCSLDVILSKYKEISLLKRLPETPNAQYVHYYIPGSSFEANAKDHILQPAFITIKEETPK